MSDRAASIDAFLKRAGWDEAERSTLAGDASFRRYSRLLDGRRRAILMDAPPPQENVRPFVVMARHLLRLGLSAPAILALDETAGLLLLEDLGDDTYTSLLAAGGDEETLYALAVDLLIGLHGRPAAVQAGLPAYDDEMLIGEATWLTDWYLPWATGTATPEPVRQSYVDAWLDLFPLVHAQPRTLVLRDYHVDNLILLPDRPGIKACGLLDFQDAVAGAAAYDLMSLLEDARRDIDDRLARAMLDRYHAAFPDRDRQAFETVYAILGAQRHAKVIGIFTRLSVRDGKSGYLVHIPRVWRLLARSLEHPSLAAVAAWFEKHVPQEMRAPPREETVQ
ncbi:MAG: phosphotransferase [Rhodospirillales bacterium]